MECARCGALLTGRQKKWCSSECSKAAGRAAWIKKVYGLEMAEYDEVWTYQEGRCAICRREPRPNEVFHIDHEHTDKGAGKVRGILCPYCNTRLVGRLKSHIRAQQLADYLKNPPAPIALGKEIIAPGRPKKKRQPRKRKR